MSLLMQSCNFKVIAIVPVLIMTLFTFTFIMPIYADGAPAGTLDIRDSEGNEIEHLPHKEIFIVTWVANNFYSGRNFDIEFTIMLEDTGEVVHHNKQTVKLNYDEVREVREGFTPTKHGSYLVEVKQNQIVEYTQFVIIDPKNNSEDKTIKNNSINIKSPLKQFKSGISSENVVCKENLQLIIKSSDRTPACVKPETKIKLVERGWQIH